MPWILFSLLTTTAFAADLAKQNVTDFLREISKLEETLQSHPECSAYRDSAKPSCARLSDIFCGTLWNANNRGNMKVGDGELKTGRTGKSDFSYRKRLDLEALAASKDRLPADLALRAKPILEKLQTALDNESDTDQWYRSVSRLQENFRDAMDETADERAAARFPDAKKKLKEDRSTEERVRIKMVANELKDEVLDAKYAQHPNWKRVEATFGEVRSAMLEMADELPFSPDLRKQFKEKLATVKLSLPYANPGTTNAGNDCDTTADNAAYSPGRNTFYVCAGSFNGMQSPSALAYVIAHELGHSIDINNQYSTAAQKLPLHREMDRLAGSKGQAIPCDAWRKVIELAKAPAPELTEPANRHHPLDHLISCFGDRSGLDPYSVGAVVNATQRKINDMISAYANDHSLLNLAQPNFRQYGKLKPNDQFLRPDLLIAQDNGTFFDGKTRSGPRLPEVLAQSLSCMTTDLPDKRISYKDVVSDDLRAALFKQGIEESKVALRGYYREEFLNCGETCPGLAVNGLAKDAGENMADWYALRTLKVMLGKQKNLATRREMALAASTFFCESPSPAAGAPKMSLTEKTYSFEEHPDMRIRRMSIFSKDNAELLNCSTEKESEGFSQCMP